MDAKDLADVLSGVPLSTAIIWGSVIIALFGAVIVGIIRLYRVFSHFREIQDNHDKNVELLLKHDEILDEMNELLKRIDEKIDTEADVHMRSLKHTITTKCNRAIKEEEILMSELRSIEEMYEDYTNIYHGNSWAHTLVEKARNLPIVYDIDDE